MDNQQPSALNGEGSQTIPVMGSTGSNSGKRCTYLYTLSDPRDNQIRYVGKTNQLLERRLSGHISEARGNRVNNRKCNWIKSLMKLGLEPIIELLDVISGNWEQEEMYWISQVRAWGFNLTNSTEGGLKDNTYTRSFEALAKKSASLKGRPRPKWVRDKISLSRRGKSLSESHKANVRMGMLGKIVSEEAKDKLRRRVYQYTKGTRELVSEFPSVTDAAKSIRGSKGTLSNALLGRMPSYKGFVWSYYKYEDIVGTNMKVLDKSEND